MFFGRYDYTIDAKGRLNFPAKFRDAMGESFVVLGGQLPVRAAAA